MKKIHKSLKIAILIICTVIIIAFVYLKFTGRIFGNNPSIYKYPIRGVDVSEYQGQIDWEVLASQDISFAFIKATEGSGYVDTYFQYNFSHAMKNGLEVGAYHFFSFESTGENQADNFIDTLGKPDKMLPPVVDVELYGDYKINPPDKEDVIKELKIILEKIEEHYNVKPIIYTTQYVNKIYIANNFSDYDIWISSITSSPKLQDEQKWTFWQYTHTGKLDGYDGKEEYIDMNVFYGSKDEFANYTKT